jgi:hypothetical protein
VQALDLQTSCKLPEFAQSQQAGAKPRRPDRRDAVKSKSVEFFHAGKVTATGTGVIWSIMLQSVV